MTVDTMEVYLAKIAKQYEEIIDLLKGIAAYTKPTTLTEDDENKLIISKMKRLSRRESQVMELIMEGRLNKQMAYDLSLSLSTIEAHRSSLMRKMDVKNITQLTKKYMIYQSLIKN